MAFMDLKFRNFLNKMGICGMYELQEFCLISPGIISVSGV